VEPWRIRRQDNPQHLLLAHNTDEVFLKAYLVVAVAESNKVEKNKKYGLLQRSVQCEERTRV
jgi:hypothetical protein